MNSYVESVLAEVEAKNPGEPEFLQAVREVYPTLEPGGRRHPEYREAKILERMAEPERVIIFRVPWVDDHGEVQINRGFRVQMNSAIGPYKGGLRFHPTVYLGLLKFLAFEQVFKNSLTDPADGRGQGRRRLRPEGSQRRRGAALLPVVHDRAVPPHRPVHRHPGRRHRRRRPGDRLPVRPVQAHHQRVHRRAHRQGLRAGAARSSGRRRPATAPSTSPRRCWPPAQESIEGKTCLVSGSGNVAQYTVEKLIELGARPVTLSDSGGFVHDPDGIDAREARLGHGAEERAPGPDPRVRREVPGATFVPAATTGDQPAVEHPRRLRLPVRHPERDQRQGRGQPARQRGHRRRRRGQHADDPRRRRTVPRLRAFSTVPARRPTPAGWRSRAGDGPGQPSTCSGPASRSTSGCARS